jgi:hypothetical protein
MKARLSSAWPLILLLAALRLLGGVILGAMPAGVVAERVKNAPAGEMALFDRDGALFAELVRRPTSLTGLGLIWGLSALLFHFISLPLLAALIERVARRTSLSDALALGLRRTPALALVSSLSTLAMMLVWYMSLLTSGSLIALFPSGSPARAWATLGFGALGLLPLAIVAVLVDLTRVELVLAPGFFRSLVAAWRRFRARALRLLALYAATSLGAVVLGALGLVGAAACAVRAGGGFAFLAVVVTVVTTVALVTVRGAWLTALVRTRTPHESEPLRLADPPGYEAHPSDGSDVLDKPPSTDEGSPADSPGLPR